MVQKHYGILLKVVFLSFLLIIVSFLFFLFGKVFFSMSESTLVSSSFTPIYTIVIDAGHGGRDGGAAVDGVYEKDLNLQISKKVAGFLSLYDVDVLFTRSDDNLLADESSKHKKRDDLYNRVQLVKNIDFPIFVSLHMNKFPEEKYKGLQVFYSSNNPYSEALAIVLQNNVKALLEQDNNRSVKKANSSIFLLDRLQCPSVLIECGFMSNPIDFQKLQSEDYQNDLAFVIANSIIQYMKL